MADAIDPEKLKLRQLDANRLLNQIGGIAGNQLENMENQNNENNNSSYGSSNTNNSEKTNEEQNTENNKSEPPTEEDLSTITDKEFLAICNFCNLRTEYADYADKRDERGNITKYRTMSEMLDKVDELFYEIEEEINEKGEKTSKRKSIYNSKDDLKIYAGVVAEYHEKWKKGGNKVGKFLDNWYMVYGNDSYGVSVNHK